MDKCDICKNKFNKEEYIPYVLRCGDTLCKKCIESKKNSEKHLITCWRCNKESSTLDLPINQLILTAYVSAEPKKCPAHQRPVGDLVCTTCGIEICFTCSRTDHAPHDVQERTFIFEEGMNKIQSIQETLAMMRTKFLSADNYIETQKECFYFTIDSKFDELIESVEKQRKDAKQKISEVLDSSILNEYYQVKDKDEIINTKMWKLHIEEKLNKWNANNGVTTMCHILRDDDARKIAIMKKWVDQDQNAKLRGELSKIRPIFANDILNHFFNINTEEYTKGGKNEFDTENFKKEQNKVKETCEVIDEIMNYEVGGHLHNKQKFLDLRKAKNIRPIAAVILNISEMEEGYPNIRLDMKQGLSSIMANFLRIKYLDIRIGDDTPNNAKPYEKLSEFLLTTQKLTTLRLDISKKSKDSSFISLIDTVRKVRELRSFALIMSNTDLPLDSISFSEKIQNLHELGKLESFELTCDDCNDSNNSFSDKKLIEALTTLNEKLIEKGNKIKSYTVNLKGFDFGTQNMEEYLGTVERFKFLTILELRLDIYLYMSDNYHKIEAIVGQSENLKLLYLDLEAKDTPNQLFDGKNLWAYLATKRDLRALLIKFTNFENYSYNMENLFESVAKLENLEEFDLNFYKKIKNYRIQMTNTEFKKCGEFLTKAKRLEEFKLTMPSLITPENLQDIVFGTKDLTNLIAFSVDFDTDCSDENLFKKILKEYLAKSVKKIDLDLRVIRKKENNNNIEELQINKHHSQ